MGCRHSLDVQPPPYDEESAPFSGILTTTETLIHSHTHDRYAYIVLVRIDANGNAYIVHLASNVVQHVVMAQNGSLILATLMAAEIALGWCDDHCTTIHVLVSGKDARFVVNVFQNNPPSLSTNNRIVKYYKM
jgi:hypothetical protein